MRNGFIALTFQILFITQTIYKCNGFKILGLFPMPIKSHYIFFEKFMKELARRGHEVHVVSHFGQEKSILNFHDININGSLPESISKISLDSGINRDIIGNSRYIFRICSSDICDYLFNHPSIINLKNAHSKFDLVISELYGTDCLLYFAHHFGATIIGISATDLLPWASDRMGNPVNPSYIPNYFVPIREDKLVLNEKMVALGAMVLSKIGYFFLSTAPSELKAREFFGKDIPPLETVISNTSLLIVNSHLSINTPRPLVPGIIEVGGLHIDNPKPLIPELEEIINSSKEGVIYFSLGTVIDLETIRKDGKLQIILNAFSNMPQTIICSGIIQNMFIPKNIVMLKWVEQLDLLCHQKLKLFVTHGGLMSMQEAAYCATPILGISIFPNQESNINKYVKNGGGLSIHYGDLRSEEALTDALNTLLNNVTYKEQAIKISNVFKERPISAMDAAVYWTEYVVKFSGARHLRSKSADLFWFEYYLVDCVIIFAWLLALGAFVSLVVLYYTDYFIDESWFNKIIARNNEKDNQTQLENHETTNHKTK